jgi:hydrogenase maturation protein HypF
MERRAVLVCGIVQGVGFRPFVHELAARLGLAGYVRNEAGSVVLEIEGESAHLDTFLTDLRGHAPPLARIEHITWETRPPLGETGFHIVTSEQTDGAVFVSPDAATCADCLAELFDPHDRRFRYPFLNCTNCGPRLTILLSAPYDRERTTMAGFPLCPACRTEYDNPADRRFHAQPTACPACGPHLRMENGEWRMENGSDPVRSFTTALRQGRIGAVKGLGGYHLVCDAVNPSAVAELRRRKRRDEKPFAVMAADLAGVEALCMVDAGERELLTSPAAPIVLLRKRPGCPVAEAIAPGNPLLGVMLPYTPLHHLLLREISPLVMTSGNRSDEPMVHRDEDVGRLADIADLILSHNRPIHVRCEDSVTRLIDGVELPVRRSRGYAPRPLMLSLPCTIPILATGAQLKGTFALGRPWEGRYAAFVSHHLGDLDHVEAQEAFRRDVALYEQLFNVQPTWLAHDLHPDYATTRYAEQRAAAEGLRLIAVQHHHAHVASCMAEHGLSKLVIGVAFDGTGFGTDGAVWGGEFLIADFSRSHRAAHLRYVGLPGGDAAVREPWRMALSHLVDAGTPFPAFTTRQDAHSLRIVERMIDRRLNTPMTSSVGRLFDAVAALAGVRDRVSHEGQAAIELESLAWSVPPEGGYPFAIEENLTIDTRPLIAAVVADRGTGPARVARRFHSTLVEIIRTMCGRIRATTGLETVVLSGGVFLNALLTSETMTALARDGFVVYRHQLVPPGDGGLSLGQLAVAAHNRDG